MIFPTQILVNFITKIANRLRRVKSFSIKFNFNFSAKFFSLMFKITSSVFSTFNDILFGFNDTVKFFMSWLTSLFSKFIVTDLLKWSKLVLSRKWWTLKNLIAWFRSLMYIKNRSGPRTEPCGTPYKTKARLDSWSLIET